MSQSIVGERRRNAGGNPWLRRGRPELLDAVSLPSGPEKPQRGVDAPGDSAVQGNAGGSPLALWVLGAHGGAGTSTIAALREEWHDGGRSWPRTADTPCVVVCRSTAAGFRAARITARQWASHAAGPVRMLGLVVVADAAGRLPRPLRADLAITRGGYPRAWSVPWLEALRLLEDPLPAESGPLSRCARELEAVLEVPR